MHQFYLIMDADQSFNNVVALLKGPVGLDLEIMFKAWYTKAVLDVIGRAPIYKQEAEAQQQSRAYHASWMEHRNSLQKQYDAKNNGWNEIFTQVLIKEHGFEKVPIEEHDFYPDNQW